MPKIIKATIEEKKSSYDRRTAAGGYHEPPLYGYVSLKCVAGEIHKCEILFLSEGRDEPNYELMAPDGYCISAEQHSSLCCTLAELRAEVNDRNFLLEICDPECPCEKAIAGKEVAQ